MRGGDCEGSREARRQTERVLSGEQRSPAREPLVRSRPRIKGGDVLQLGGALIGLMMLGAFEGKAAD